MNTFHLTARRRRTTTLVSGTLIGALALAACGGGSSGTSSDRADIPTGLDAAPVEETTEITVSLPSFASAFDAVVIADAMGEFEAENLDVTFSVHPPGEDILLLTQGTVDVVLNSVFPGTLNLLSEDDERMASVFPGGGRSADTREGFYIRKDLLDDPTQVDPEVLRDARLASPGGSGAGPWAFVFNWAAENGVELDPNDFEIENLTLADSVSALANGSVDVAYVGAVFADPVEDSGCCVLIEDAVPSLPSSFVWFGERLNKEDPVAGQAFLRAIARAERDYLQGDYFADDEVVDALAEYRQVEPAQVRAGEPAAFDLSFDLEDNPAWESFQAYFRQTDALTYDEDLTFDQIYDTEFVENLRR